MASLNIYRIFMIFIGFLVLIAHFAHQHIEGTIFYDPFYLRVFLASLSLFLIGVSYFPLLRKYTSAMLRALLTISTVHGLFLTAANQIAESYAFAALVFIILVIIASEDEKFLTFYVILVVTGSGAVVLVSASPLINPFVYFVSSVTLALSAYVITANQLRLKNELKRSGREVEKSKEQVERIVSSIPLPVIIVDQNGIIHFWNDAAEEKLGWKRTEVLYRLFPAIGYSQRSAFLEYLHEVIGEKSPTMRSTELLTSTGKTLYVLASCSIMEVPGGRERILISLTDVSLQKEYEKELEFARQKAEEASRMKSEFLARMSHEIRTPLNGILPVLDMLRSSRLEGEQRQNLDIVISSAELLIEIINDILDYSKIEQGYVSLERRPFALENIISLMYDAFFARARTKNLQLVKKVDERLAPCYTGDSMRLRQVLANLLSNAIKFTADGVVKLEVSLEQAGDGKDRILFSVTDSGIGVPGEKQKVIFESFKQADESTTRQYGGSGLGLAISTHLIALMHGKISVESPLEAESSESPGSRFYFSIELPRCEKNDLIERRKEESVSDGLENLSGKKALIVEDNIVNRLVLRKVLDKIGLIVDEADNGALAVDKCMENHFDIVFMDVEMPVMNGYEACEKIRKEGYNRETPIICVSAHAFAEDTERAMSAGMSAYISKPISVKNVEKTLVDFLQPKA